MCIFIGTIIYISNNEHNERLLASRHIFIVFCSLRTQNTVRINGNTYISHMEEKLRIVFVTRRKKQFLYSARISIKLNFVGMMQRQKIPRFHFAKNKRFSRNSEKLGRLRAVLHIIPTKKCNEQSCIAREIESRKRARKTILRNLFSFVFFVGKSILAFFSSTGRKHLLKFYFTFFTVLRNNSVRHTDGGRSNVAIDTANDKLQCETRRAAAV